MKPTCLEKPRPSAQVWEPLEYSLQALDSDSSLPLPLPLLRGHVRLSRLGHLPAGIPAFPFLWTSWKIMNYVINEQKLSEHYKEMDVAAITSSYRIIMETVQKMQKVITDVALTVRNIFVGYTI